MNKKSTVLYKRTFCDKINGNYIVGNGYKVFKQGYKKLNWEERTKLKLSFINLKQI